MNAYFPFTFSLFTNLQENIPFLLITLALSFSILFGIFILIMVTGQSQGQKRALGESSSSAPDRPDKKKKDGKESGPNSPYWIT